MLYVYQQALTHILLDNAMAFYVMNRQADIYLFIQLGTIQFHSTCDQLGDALLSQANLLYKLLVIYNNYCKPFTSLRSRQALPILSYRTFINHVMPTAETQLIGGIGSVLFLLYRSQTRR